MGAFLAQLLVTLLAHSIDLGGLVSAVEDEIKAVAHGKGGPDKVAAVLTGLNNITETVAKVASDVAAPVAAKAKS